MRSLVLVALLSLAPPALADSLHRQLPALGVSLDLPLGWLIGAAPQAELDPQLIYSAAHPTWPAVQIGRGPEQEGELSVYEHTFRQRLYAEGYTVKERREGVLSGQPSVSLLGNDGHRLAVVTLAVLHRRLYYVLIENVEKQDSIARLEVYHEILASMQATP